MFVAQYAFRQALDPRVGAMFGSFRIVRKIGEGGMGVVYEAEHIKIGRRAAVKLLHPHLAQDEEYAQRFLNEARAVNIVRHRGLVEIFEFGQLPDGTLFFVMELLQGESLQKWIMQRKAPASQPEAVRLSVQLARALAAAHKKGIVHREKLLSLISTRESPLWQQHGKTAELIGLLIGATPLAYRLQGLGSQTQQLAYQGQAACLSTAAP